MFKRRLSTALAASVMTTLCLLPTSEALAETMMSPAWAEQACAAWNAESTLTEGLSGKWARNDGGKGHKVIQLYRRDCGEQASAEMRIALEDELAKCSYGGAVETGELDEGSDYLMFADTSRWEEMGRGEYGPMKAMMFGRLKFVGPDLEAMGNMGPFKAFLRLVGSIPGETDACPGA